MKIMSETKNEKSLFVGPRKVSHVVAEEMKTYGGNDVVTVHYEGGYSELMPKKSYEAVVTEAPTDFTALGAKKVAITTKEVLAVLAEHHIRGDEIETITNSIQNELYNSFNKATHILWTGESKTFTPGTNAVLERSLLEAHKVIISTPNDEPPKETKSADAESKNS